MILQLGLGDLASGLRRRRDQLAAFALEPRGFAFERGQPGQLDQVFGIEFVHACELAMDEVNLFGLRGLLCGEPLDFLPELGDLLAQLIPLSVARRTTQSEQLHLARHRRRHFGVVGVARQLCRERDHRGAVAFGRKAGLAGEQLVEALGDDRQVGAGDRVVEPHDHVAGPDAVAVVHLELADHAAGGMLHFLDVGIDDDRALRDDGALDLRGRRPAADAAGQQEDKDEARDHVTPHRATRVGPPPNPWRVAG